MGQDGNTIEIEIDAAATVAAAKTAGEANAKLVKFDQALGLFRDNVGLVSKTTEDVATRMGDFNTILQKFADNLTTNLADMQTSVVQKIEPHLERELENMVNRVLNKVEAKTGTTGESRSRSEAKQGAAAPTTPNVATAKQDSDYKRPDAIIKQMSSQIGSTVQDAITGAFTDTKTIRMRTEVRRTKRRQYSDLETGEQLEERTVTTDISNAISKAVTKSSDAWGKNVPLTGRDKQTADLFNFMQTPQSARPTEYPVAKTKGTFYGSISDALDQSLGKGFIDPIQQYGEGMNAAAEKNIWRPYEQALKDNEKASKSATVAEKDRGTAIRKEITGALIGLHVMKVVSQYSSVFNAGFQMVFAGIGHLLNNILLPMMPMFVIIGQVFHTLANVFAMLPMPIRYFVGALLMWKATSMLIASMPLRDIKDGFKGIAEVMRGAGSGLEKFIRLVGEFIDFMNSGQVKGAVSWIGSGLGKVGGAIGGGVKKLLGKRAGGGPVLGHGAYIVGEKGPEIFVPKTSGSIIPNHKIGRSGGGDVVPTTTTTTEPGGTIPLPDLGAAGIGGLAGAGLGYMFTGSPAVAAGGALFGAGLGGSGVDIAASIASGLGWLVSQPITQQIMAGMHMITATIAAMLAPIAPLLGVIGAVVGAASGAKSALGGGGDATAETVAKVGNAQLKQTAAMSYGVQNAVNVGNRSTSTSLMSLLLRLNGCLKVAPCVPGIFGVEVVAAITALGATITGLPTTIRIALEDIAAKIKYTIETIGTPPEAVDKTATITYDIVTRGTEPVVTPREGTVTYTETLRTLSDTDIVNRINEINSITETKSVDIATRLVDVSETEISRVIDVANVATSAVGREVVFRSVVTSPTVQDIISRVGEVTRILTENPAEMVVTPREFAMAEWNARIEAQSVADPVEITATLLADGTSIPTIDLYGRVLPELDVSGVTGTPVEIIGNLVSPDSPIRFPVEVYVPPGALVEVPAGTRALVPVVFESGGFDPGSNWEKVGDNMFRFKGTASANVNFNGGAFDPGPEWEKVGENLWRRKSPVEVPAEVKVPDAKTGSGAWTSFGKGLGGVVGFGILDGIREYLKTGTIDWGAFFQRQLLYLVAGGVIAFFCGALVAQIVGLIATYVMVKEVKGLFDPIMQNWLDGYDGSGFLGNLFSRIFRPEDNAVNASVFGPVFGGLLSSIIDTGLGFISGMDFSGKLTKAFMDAGLGGILNIGTGMSIVLDPSTTLTQKLEAFNNMFKQTVNGGIPVNVAIDVDSVTSVVNAVRETAMGTPISGGASTPDEVVQECQPGFYWDRALQACAPINGSVIPSHAAGGRVIPNIPNLVGEKGPELFIPDSSPTSIGGGGGSTQPIQVTQHFHVTTNNPKELTDTVMRELKLELARVKM